MSRIAVSISTRVKPPRKFLLDETEYELLGPDHLSADDENEVLALFARHAYTTRELEVAGTLNQGTAIAARLRKLQEKIISKTTTVPLDVIATLPPQAKAKLLEAVRDGLDDDDLGEEPAATKGETPGEL